MTAGFCLISMEWLWKLLWLPPSPGSFRARRTTPGWFGPLVTPWETLNPKVRAGKGFEGLELRRSWCRRVEACLDAQELCMCSIRAEFDSELCRVRFGASKQDIPMVLGTDNHQAKPVALKSYTRLVAPRVCCMTVA